MKFGFKHFHDLVMRKLGVVRALFPDAALFARVVVWPGGLRFGNGGGRAEWMCRVWVIASRGYRLVVLLVAGDTCNHLLLERWKAVVGCGLMVTLLRVDHRARRRIRPKRIEVHDSLLDTCSFNLQSVLRCLFLW